jgi:hypothetical protein
VAAGSSSHMHTVGTQKAMVNLHPRDLALRHLELIGFAFPKMLPKATAEPYGLFTSLVLGVAFVATFKLAIHARRWRAMCCRSSASACSRHSLATSSSAALSSGSAIVSASLSHKPAYLRASSDVLMDLMAFVGMALPRLSDRRDLRYIPDNYFAYQLLQQSSALWITLKRSHSRAAGSHIRVPQ